MQTMDEVDFTILAAKSVFTDMIDKCPPAETCRDAFDRTARATIKMASANGGFGALSRPGPPHRTSSATWGASKSATPTPPQSQHRSRLSDQQSFNFDLSLSDSLSSPSMSVTGEMAARPSPPLSTAKSYDTDYMIPSQGSGSPVDVNIKQEGGTSSSMQGVRRLASSQQASRSGSTNTYMGQQFGMQGPMDYPDNSAMDFLQGLGAAPNGDFGNVDQAQVDLGFGINWEGLPNDYGDNQQINPFDTFFFGGAPGGSGNGPGGMGL